MKNSKVETITWAFPQRSLFHSLVGAGLSVPIFFWAEKPKKRISTSIPNANFIYILVSIIFHQLFFLETLIFARLTK